VCVIGVTWFCEGSESVKLGWKEMCNLTGRRSFFGMGNLGG
jgi:hypothetical protein